MIATELTEKEVELIQFIRNLEYGSFELVVKNSTPIMIKQVIKTVML